MIARPGLTNRGGPTLFGQYTDQLGRLIARHRADVASKAAKAAAELSAAAAQQAMLEVQAGSRAKSEFLANMSHELRTPLNAILGFSELMLLGMARNPEKVEEYAQNINGAAQHLLALINDILDLARIEAGKLELMPEEVDASVVLATCLMIVKERANQGGVTLSVDEPTGPLRIWADERKLKQIVLNLISNAVKFTPTGGSITVVWRRTESGGSRLSVADTGIGIDQGDLEKVFRPFVQVDGRLNRKYEGVGLGLPLTRRLVELHGGSLNIKSEVGRGTTVTVDLPPQNECPKDRSASPLAAVAIETCFANTP
jgi:signal transduction histidine kinase